MKSDIELLAEFKRGNQAAFRSLMRRHHVSLYNFFYMLVHRHDLADSLTCEVFLRLFAAKDLLQTRTDFAIYLYRTGCTCWADYLRRTSPIAALPAGETAEPPQRSEAPDLELLVRQLAYLPPELRLTLVLHETCDLSYQEIARVLEVPHDVVKRRVSEGFNLLLLQARVRQDAEARLNLPGPTGK